MSRGIHDADREEFEGKQLERVFDECAIGVLPDDNIDEMEPEDFRELGMTEEDADDERDSEELLERIVDLQALEEDDTFGISARVHYNKASAEEYIVERHLLGSSYDWVCNVCKTRNSEDNNACEACGTSYEKSALLGACPTMNDADAR